MKKQPEKTYVLCKTAECLEYLRTKVYHLSQEKFAALCGICRPQYHSYIKKGSTPRELTVRAMAKQLGVPFTALMDLNEAQKVGKKIAETVQDHDVWYIKVSKAISQRMRPIRLWRSMSYAEIAELTGISASSLQIIEKGTQKLIDAPAMLPSLCQCLRVDENVFLNEDVFVETVPLEYRISDADLKALMPLIGARIRLLRHARATGLVYMGQDLDIDYTAIARYELGVKPIPRHLIRPIAEYLGTTAEDLLSVDSSGVSLLFASLPAAKDIRAAKRKKQKKELGMDEKAIVKRMDDIGQSLRIILQRRGISNENFAKMMGVSISMVSSWTYGKVDKIIAIMPVIAEQLKVPVKVLFDPKQALKVKLPSMESGFAKKVLDLDQIGGRLFHLRSMRGQGRKAVANAIGVLEPTVLDWETGKTPIGKMEAMAIAGYFQIPIQVLMNTQEFKAYIEKEEK